MISERKAKNTYIQPECKVIETKVNQMICCSNEGVNVNPGGW